MDSTVIQEIASQLDMAVDDTSVFIQQCLPQYAGLHILYNVMYAIICIALIIITVVVARKIFVHQQHDMDGDFCTTIIVLSTIVVALCAFCLVCNVGNAVGWAVFPEASLIDTVFDCVKE